MTYLMFFRLLSDKYFGDLVSIVEGFMNPSGSANSLLTGMCLNKEWNIEMMDAKI